jgi:hypothetical protein
MSSPAAGITTSHRPKTAATLNPVSRSTPLTPMAIAAEVVQPEREGHD